jgi:hypothetical protein
VSIPPSTGRADRHIAFLGVLLQLWAAFHGLIGLALGFFAVSAALVASSPEGRPGVEIAAGVTAVGFGVLAAAAVAWSLVHLWCGRALRRHNPAARLLALALALLNVLLFPLGTLLAAYSAWVLLHDDVRARFVDRAPSTVHR